MSTQENPEEPINHSRNSRFWCANFFAISQREKKNKNNRKGKEIAGPTVTISIRRHFQNLSRPTVILTISCVIAVIVDPLFFYLPIIDETNKCIGMDTTLRNVVLTLRSLTDIGFIVHIIHKIREAVRKTKKEIEKEKEKTDGKPNRDERSKFAKALARNLSWHSIAIDFFAVLPIPQVVIVAVRSSSFLHRTKILNFFLLAQYVPRIHRMRHSSKKLRKKTGMWVKGSFYFFLYLLASHELGGFWYYFSIQQEISCWDQACEKHSTRGCNFYCNENMISRNTTVIDSLNEFCPVHVPTNETAPFDFGIFLDSLKNGNTGSIHFAKKFFYSFWWGLRNLSNFGTNLQTSTYVWENCFAILISIIGLLLFLYFIGKVQTFISIKTEKSEARINRFKLKDSLIHGWIGKYRLPNNMREDIKKNVNQKWEQIRDVDIENLFYILPAESQNSLRRSLCMDLLRKVPKLKNLKGKAFKLICAFLKPVVYQDNSFIFQIGEPLDRILFITEGLVWTYEAAATSNSNSCTSQVDGIEQTSFSFLQKGGFYGDDQLLSWAIASDKNDLSFGNLPISNANVKCHAKVEGFVLMAKDLKTVVSKIQWGFYDSAGEREADSAKEREAASQTIQNAFRRWKDRQRKRSLRGGRLSNKIKAFFHCCDSTHLVLTPKCLRPGLSIKN